MNFFTNSDYTMIYQGQPTTWAGEIDSKHEQKITFRELFLAPQHKRSASYLTCIFVDFYWLAAGLVCCTVVEANSILLK